MSLTKEESKLIREALGVATSVSNDPNLVAALRTLNTSLTDFEQYDDDSYKYSLVGAENIREAEQLADSVYPGAYTTAWAALRRELVAAPPVDKPEPPPPDVGNPDSPDVPHPEVPVGDFAAAVVQALAQYGIYVQPNKLGVGVVPRADAAAALQIGGAAVAGILGVSNVNRTDGQNPDYPHENMFVIADNDGGMRGVQYGRWFNGHPVRNTPNRRMSIFALFDSMGDTCINDDQSEPGQNIYIVRDPSSKTVTIAAYKPGWRIRVVETSSGAPYATQDVPKL
jgi:hypothetical protein